MKRKTGIWAEIKKNNIFSLSACLFVFLFLSCGLDTFYVMDPPITDHTAVYSSTDYATNYFLFRTSETTSHNKDYNGSAGFKFLGTEVYYKIYNNYSTMNSDISRVENYLDADDPTSASDYIINNSNMNYRTLAISSGDYSPLIKNESNNRYVYIRLTDFEKDGPFQQGICLNDSQAISTYDSSMSLKYGSQIVYPRRNISKSGCTFNFGGDDDDYDLVPLSDDEDVKYSSSVSEEGVWYVNMYAISTGYDTSYTIYYSEPLHLGSVSIKVGEDN